MGKTKSSGLQQAQFFFVWLFFLGMAFSKQITTVSIFRFEGWADRFWALSQMGLAPRRIGQVPGLQRLKFMGSGGTNGFGIRPNFGVYALLGVWSEEAAAVDFFARHPVFAAYRQRCTAWQTHFLRNNMAHGAWDGHNPFEAGAAFDPQAPVAVLTRATIRRRRLLYFWRQVPGVSSALEGKPGLRFAIGIGELPLVQQATFSLWDSGKAMMDYAYRGAQHAEVIRQTRSLGWYKEELFARFEPYRVEESGLISL
jgi:hypothetical protein